MLYFCSIHTNFCKFQSVQPDHNFESLQRLNSETLKHCVTWSPTLSAQHLYWRTETPGFDLCMRRNTWPQQPTSSCPAPVREPSSRLPEDSRWAGPPSTCAPASQCKASRRCALARWGSSSTSRSVRTICYKEGSMCMFDVPRIKMMLQRISTVFLLEVVPVVDGHRPVENI